MQMKLSEIAEMLGGSVVGDPNLTVEGVSAPDLPAKNHLSVVWEKGVSEKLPIDVPLLSQSHFFADGRVGVSVADPRAALVTLLTRFDERRPYTPLIHPTSVVDPSVLLGQDLYIGAHCVVEEKSEIGDRCVLQSGVHIGRNVRIGRDCRFEAGVVIHDDTWIGDRVIIKSNSVVGSDGFGFIQDKEGQHIRIPQIGRVVLENDVELGALVTVDRATFGETRLEQGTKVGNHVQIAHNSKIGKNCVFVGFIAMGGSVVVGDNSLVAGFAGVADHVSIGKGVTVAGRSGVSKTVADHEVISGFPAQSHKKEQRLQASLRRVPELQERLKLLEKKISKMEQNQ